MNLEQRRRSVQELTHSGFIVVPPGRSASQQRLHRTPIQQRLLVAFANKFVDDRRSKFPTKLPGYTDAEVSALFGHPDLHRRTVELRNCGLIDAIERDGSTMRRERSIVWEATPAGVAAAQSLLRIARKPDA